MPEKQRADDGHHNKLFQQFITQVINGPVNQLAAIVRGNNLNTFRQAGLQRLQFIFYRGNHFTRVFTRTQDHHTARDLSLAVKLGDPAPHFRSGLYASNITQINRYSVLAGFQDDVIEIINGLKITAGPDHILCFRHFDR